MKSSKILIAGLISAWLTMGMSNAVLAQTQNCTFENWSTSVGDDNLRAGSQGAGNRRFAGPCGLRVQLAGSEAYVQDESPTSESTFNVRFYFYLNEISEDVTLFEARSATTRVFAATYDDANNQINVAFSTGDGSTSSTLSVGPVAAGSWNSLEIQWSKGSTANQTVTLVNASGKIEEESGAINTDGFTVDTAKLGAVSAIATVPSGGSIDFDDYDSRRDSVPGTLCRGLTNSSRDTLDLEDVQAIFTDFATGGSVAAAGTPDHNMDGKIDLEDVSNVFSRFATGQNACSANR